MFRRYKYIGRHRKQSRERKPRGSNANGPLKTGVAVTTIGNQGWGLWERFQNLNLAEIIEALLST